MYRTRTAATSAVAVLAVALAGCAGAEDDLADTPPVEDDEGDEGDDDSDGDETSDDGALPDGDDEPAGGDEPPDGDQPADGDDEPAGDDGSADDGAADDDDAPADEDEVSDEPDRVEPDPSDDAGESDVSAGLDEWIEIAIEDLTDRAGVDAQDVTTITAERVTWSDGSLGCPESDRMYTMALVDGYRIVLEADGQRYAYHGEDGSEPFYCAAPRDPSGDQGRVES